MPVTQPTSYVALRSGSNLTSPTTMNNSIAGNHSQPQSQHHQYQQQQQQQYQNQSQKQQQSSTTPTSPDFLTPTSSVSSSSSPSTSSPFRRTYANQPPPPTTSTAARSTAGVPVSSTVSVFQWKEPEIASFLHSIKCGHLIRMFEAHDITGSVILELVDVALLKEMGIDRVGDRVRLISGLKALKASSVAAAAAAAGGTARSSRQESADGGSLAGAGQETYRAGPRVIVTRGEGLSGYGRASPAFAPTPLIPPPPPPPHSPSYVHHQSGAAQTYALLGRRPAPLDIAPLGQHVTDPRSAQAHQYSPDASHVSSASQQVSRTYSKESFLHSPASQMNSNRLPQSLMAPPDALPMASSQQQLLPAPPLCPQPSAFSDLTSEPSSTSIVGHFDGNSRAIASSLSGGSFTERRAHLARERQTDLVVTSASSSSPYSSSASSSNRPNFPSHPNEKQPTGNRGLNGRSVPFGGGSSHPFATTPATPSSPTYPPLSSSNPPHPHTGMSASGSMAGSISQTGRATPPLLHSSGSASGIGSTLLVPGKTFSGSAPMALEDLRQKCFKFTNAEDGGTRVVNLGGLTDGMEVMEKALRKFGKWRDGGAKGVKGVEYLESSDEGETEREMDERRAVGPGGGKEENGLVVDGWGIFLKDYGGEVDTSKPLTAKELVQVCQVPFDSPTRQSGLILKRIRKLHNRKAMEAFFGETPPVPESPTSQIHQTNKHARHPVDHKDGSAFYSGSSGSGLTRSSSKKMNRASTISVMSGLGVPLGPQTKSSIVVPHREPPQRTAVSPATADSTTTSTEQSTSTAPAVKSPSTTSFLGNRGRKMYNFFGHRPPSELISNHLADYFPKVQKKVLERTARNSMMRIASGPPGSSASGPPFSEGGAGGPPRLSWEEARSKDPRASGLGYGSLPRERRVSHSGKSVRSFITTSSKGGMISSEDVPQELPTTSTPESYITRDESFDVPRLSISTDGSVSERASMISMPPYLPDFIPSGESFSDSLAVYSPSFGSFSFDSSPVGVGAKGRKSSFDSSSRMSLLSQFRKKRDMSDTASMRTVDEITAHVESKRASTVSDSWIVSGDGKSTSGDEQEDEDEEEQVVDEQEDERGDLMRGFRRTRDSDSVKFSRSFTKRSSSYRGKEHDFSVGMDNGDESELGEEENEREVSDEEYTEGESDGEEYDDEEDEEEEEEEENIASVEDEHGKAFMSEGNKRSFKWIKGALIGSGSFGSVFLGMAASTGLLMAVKQVDIPTGQSANEEKKKLMLSALETEIELLKELQHDNIVQYLDSSMDAAHLNIFLEYVPGGSVTALLGNYGAFEEALVRIFVRQTLQGLVYLHEKGIIHRDIKGANILVDNKGGIKISDFGISKRVETDLLTGVNQRRSLQGTVFWMAPEVVRQTAHTPKADIWSVGCLVVEMLTGQRPWGHLDQMQVMFKIGGSARPEYPPDITSEAEDFLNKTFIFDYNDRLSASDCLVHPFIVESLE